MEYFVAEINLLAAMCKGDNTTVIQTLQFEGSMTFGVRINFELIMSATIDHKLRMSHPQLVAALIELFKGLLAFFAV